MEFQLKSRQKLLHFNKPQVMGIINVNASSFFEGSQAQTEEEVRKKADQMKEEGATFLDLGAMSTQPGSKEIPLKDEVKQIEFALKCLKKDNLKVLLSVDTYRLEVAQKAAELGVDFINDISAGEDERLLEFIANEELGYIAMHKQGVPETMQQNPIYDDVTKEVAEFLIKKNAQFQKLGIHSWCADLGFGFGKTLEHNFQLLMEMKEIKNLVNKPMLVGVSRKGMIYRTLGTSAKEALNGTTAIHMAALMNGGDILRVHDVKEAIEVVSLFTAMKGNE